MMKRTDRILMACSEVENSMQEISETAGLSRGAALTAVNKLVEAGLLRRTGHGFYATTRHGMIRIGYNPGG